ncbi:hypothetical protein Agub_g166 [Astrephomene gubernaculifera]|uniref:Serine aminopeptidase S33 domain-containing protein n=1 Tax=Astrephomene gubernaculifera TaxID=47775 RepID=A0AAD3DGQ7_9CHLO|nr:hypothetical protein Agub_g166 [Astrephomene gubernaculifera]
MGKTTGSFTNGRGQKLYTVEWTPEEGEVKAVMFWHHGFGEYMDRFDASAEVWSSAGIAVYGYDAAGMGRSEPLQKAARGLVARFEHLVADAEEFLSKVLRPSLASKGLAAVPLFLAGNSLGGLVASYVAARQGEQVAGLVMQSPAIDVEWTPVLRFQAMLGNLLAALLPRAKLVPAVRPEDMSQDPRVVAEYLADPLIYQGNVKALTGNEILKGFRGLVALRPALRLPIFAVHGTSDRCTSLPALRTHLAALPSPDVTLREVAGGYHELLHGPEKEQVRGDIRDWVLQRAGKKEEAEKQAEKGAAEAEGAGEVASEGVAVAV